MRSLPRLSLAEGGEDERACPLLEAGSVEPTAGKGSYLCHPRQNTRGATLGQNKTSTVV